MPEEHGFPPPDLFSMEHMGRLDLIYITLDKKTENFPEET